MIHLGYLSTTAAVGLVGIVGLHAMGGAMAESLRGQALGSVVTDGVPQVGSRAQAAGLGWARHFGKLPDAVKKAVRAEREVLQGVIDFERAQSMALQTTEQTAALGRANSDLAKFDELVEAAGASYLTRDPSPLFRLQERLADWLSQDHEAGFQRLLAQHTVLDGELPVRKTASGIPRVTIDPREGRFVHITGVSNELDAETLARVRRFYDAFEDEISFSDLQLEIALPGDNAFRSDAVQLLEPMENEPFRFWIGQDVEANLAQDLARNARQVLAQKLGQPQFQDGLVNAFASDLDAELAALTGGVDPRVARLEAVRQFQSAINAKRPGETPHIELFEFLFPSHQVQFLGGVDHGKGGPLYARFTRNAKLGNVLELRGDVTAPGAVEAERMVELVDRQARYADALLDNGVELHVTLAKGADEAFGGDFQGAKFIDVGIDHDAPDAVLRAVLERAQQLDD